MTISPPAVRLGAQRPRVRSVPPSSSSAGVEAVELAASAGLVLDPWQRYALEDSLGERPDGRWAAYEVAMVVARQNGKGAVLEARELAGLFLFGERLIIHSSHEFKTAQEAFRRVKALIDNTDDLRRRVARVHNAHGSEGIELVGGARLRFIARSKSSGRGFTGDLVILDEAFDLPDYVMTALMPTMSARPNPQLWYMSSAVDRTHHEHGRTLAAVRRRGLDGDPDLAYFEWSPDFEGLTDAQVDAQVEDPETWWATNPGMGIRISEEHVGREFRAMGRQGFRVERLSDGLWPAPEESWSVISSADWRRLRDPDSQIVSGESFAIDATPSRGWASIGVAGFRSDGLEHIEVVAHEPGLSWVVPWLTSADREIPPAAVALDPGGPAGSLVDDLESAGVAVALLTARELAQATGSFRDAERAGRFRHIGQAVLDSAVASAELRPLGDAQAWSRTSGGDASPLMAVTLARHLAMQLDQLPPNLW